MTATTLNRATLVLGLLAPALLAGAIVEAAGLKYATPQGWHAIPPQSSMRVAQFMLPRADGDPEGGELVVYYFGGGGGSVAANMDRWLSQMLQPDGKPSRTAAREEQRTVNGMKVTLLDVSGRYVADTMPGSGQRVDKPDFRLRAGVVQTPNGPYFLKLTGPQKTIAKWERAFEEFVASLRYEP